MIPNKPRSIVDWPLKAQYALALSTVLCALGVRFVLASSFGARFPFFPVFLVLLPLAFVVRSGPFLAAALLGAFASMYLFLEPVRTWRLHERDLLQVALFFASLVTLVLTAWLSRRNQRRLRHADAMLRAFVDESPSPKWVTDPQGRIVYVNAAMAAAVGAPVNEIIGRPQAEVLPFKDGHSGADQIRALPVDGEDQPRMFEWRRFPLHVRPQQSLMAGIATDITEEHKYAAALRDSEARLAFELRAVSRMRELGGRRDQFNDLLQEILDAAIEITGADMGNMQLLQDGRLRIVAHRGFKPPFLTFFDAVHEGRAACGTAMLRGERVVIDDVSTNPVFSDPEMRAVMQEAGVAAVQSSPLITRAGDVVGMISTHYRQALRPSEQQLRLLDLLARQAADLLEKHRVEQQLREREAQLEAVIGLTPFMITRCSRDLRYRFVSVAYAKMLGRSQADIAGKTIAEIMGITGLTTIMPYIERVLRGETVEYEDHVEFEGVGVRVLNAVYTPDRNEQGDVTGWVASIVDMTEMRKNQADLAAAVKERERLLESERAARIEAEQATRVKDEFLATLSHELRTPLNAILGWIRLIEKNPDDRKMLRDGIPIIARNAKVQMDLIADLLDTSRIISGKIRLDLQPLHIADVVTAAVETIRPIAESKMIRVTRSIASFNEPVLGDDNRLQQIVWNLLSNAVKFTPNGGRIDVKVTKNGSNARIIVSDTGEGINAAFLPHLFERFRQADASTSRRFVGLGLGLAIVKHLVGLHGGMVHAHSDGDGRGATFTVELPLAKEMSDPRLITGKSAPAFVPEVVDLSGVTVLAVEDHADALDLLKRVLEERNAHVLTAASADDALELLRAERPGILISDIAMPGKDGYQLIRELRKAGDDTPAIAVTAFARSEDVTRAIEAGYQAHVSKPVDENTLIAAVSTYARCRINPDATTA